MNYNEDKIELLRKGGAAMDAYGDGSKEWMELAQKVASYAWPQDESKLTVFINAHNKFVRESRIYNDRWLCDSQTDFPILNHSDFIEEEKGLVNMFKTAGKQLVSKEPVTPLCKGDVTDGTSCDQCAKCITQVQEMEETESPEDSSPEHGYKYIKGPEKGQKKDQWTPKRGEMVEMASKTTDWVKIYFLSDAGEDITYRYVGIDKSCDLIDCYTRIRRFQKPQHTIESAEKEYNIDIERP